ncbi:hypothetical protein AAVH_32821, partial [Aphelenchoides avenae]
MLPIDFRSSSDPSDRLQIVVRSFQSTSDHRPILPIDFRPSSDASDRLPIVVRSFRSTSDRYPILLIDFGRRPNLPVDSGRILIDFRPS